MTARRRVLQAAFLVTALALVVLADLIADRLAVLSPGGPAGPFVAIGGRVLGGFAVGLAFRLQHSRRLRPDPSLRLLVGVPCALLAAAPMLLTLLPALPGLTGALVAVQRLAPFAGAVLGLALALAVRPARR